MRQRYEVSAIVPWAAILLIALVVMLPLWGAPPYGDDIRLHIYRIPVVQALWANGIPFARWLPTLNLGYGSPLFNFYPPLSAYLLTLFYLLMGQQTAVAWNLLLALALLAGCVGMFLWGRWLYGARGGVLAAALYTWSPHLVYQSFARGSSSNALAMALFPWAAWALTAVASHPSPQAVGLAGVAVALVMLSHTAASFLFLGPLVVIAGTAVMVMPARRGQRLAAVLLAVGVGLALSAFSWLPALAEIGATRYAAEASKVAYQDFFADVFRWPEQTVAGAHNPGLPKTPGFAQMVLGGVGTALAAFIWRRRTADGQAAVVAVSGMMGLLTLVLALVWSEPVWALLPPLQSLQFPWRLLDIPVFCLALAGGFVLGDLPGQRRPQWGRWGLAVAGLVVAFANVLPYLYPPRLDSLPEHLTLAEATAVQQQFGIYGLTAWGEYSAATVTDWPVALPFPGADEMLPLGARLVGEMEGVTAVSGDPWRVMWQTNLAQAETIMLAVHQFPGWRAWVDGEPVAVGVDGDGRVQLTIPPGSHQVELAFSRTPVRWLADGLTLVGLVAVVGLLVGGWRRSRREMGTVAVLAAPSAVAKGGVLLLVVVGLLLGIKVVGTDRVSSPLVVHPADGRIPGKVAPTFGVFDDQIRLVAYETSPPGTLVLYWQALADVDKRYQVVVTVADAQGRPLATVVNEAPGYMSTAHWRAGHLARDVYMLPLDGQPAPAGYTLWVGLAEVASGEAVLITDAPGATAVPVGRLKTAPPLLHVPETQAAVFGEVIRLRQADLPEHLAVEEELELTLIWESLTPVAADYTVFVHLLNEDGTLAAGNDGQPLHGRYPTSFWSPGETIMDVRQWQPGLPPGIYHLTVGLYRLDSGERLPVSGPQAAGVDWVILGEVEIGE